MNHIRYLFLGCFLIIFSYSTVLLGQSKDSLYLKVQIVKSSDVIADDFSFMIEVTNESPSLVEYYLDSLRILLPTEVSKFYELDAIEIKPKTLPAKSKLLLIVPFRKTNSSGLGKIFNEVKFLPGSYKVTMILFYGDPVKGIDPLKANKDRKVITWVEEVYFKPPISSLLVGGIMGSFLLTLFISIFSLKNNVIDRNWIDLMKKNWLVHLIKQIITFLFGSIVSIVSILVIQRVSDFSLPISLKVEDYLGGIIIGMLSLKLGDSLYNMFVKK
jgi:hypothetical protein